LGEILRKNFGGYLVGLIVVVLTYSAISIWYPQYASAFAIITLLGIAMFYLNQKKG
jgi:hypothetical protein